MLPLPPRKARKHCLEHLPKANATYPQDICQTEEDAELLDLYLDCEMYTSLYQAP